MSESGTARSRRPFPTFVDLRLLAQQLAGHPNIGKINKALRKAALAQSCVTDLTQSADCCAALRQTLASPRKTGTAERAAVESSLLMSAVVLYARATDGNGGRGERGSIQISARLTDRQAEDHALIVKARNRAIAHVYHDEELDEEIWHSTVSLAVATNEGWLPAIASKRVQIHRSLLTRLDRQIPVAQAIVTSVFHAHTNAIITAMNEAQIGREAALASKVDPVGIFGSARAVERILAGIPAGRATLLD